MSDSISIKNIQAIHHLSIEMPSGGGGVVVLTGRNGAGKTTAISAIAALLGVDEVRLGVARGEEVGEVEGLGRRIRVGKVQKATGKPEVAILRGIDLATIVDPKVSDADARTKYRVRELVSLGGAKVTPQELAKGCEELVDIEAASVIDDPIKQADFLKRQLEAAAREAERKADVDAGVSKSKLLEAGDVDQLKVARLSSGDLAAAHRRAQSALEAAKKQVSDYQATVENNANLERQIGEILQRSAGQRELAEIDSDLSSINSGMAGVAEEIKKLELRLAELKSEKVKVESERKVVSDREATIEQLSADIQIVDESTLPKAEDIAALELEEKAAYNRLVGAADFDRRCKALEESRKLLNSSADKAQESQKIRDLIAAIHGKIQKLIPSGPLEIDGGKLIFKPREVPFDELSEGERWSVVMRYAIEAVGIGGVIPLSQEGWQSLAPALKAQICDIAKEAGVVVITAQVDDGELRAVEFSS